VTAVGGGGGGARGVGSTVGVVSTSVVGRRSSFVVVRGRSWSLVVRCASRERLTVDDVFVRARRCC